MPSICIVCKTRTSRRFSLAKNYEQYFLPCFGVNPIQCSCSGEDGRHKICEGCRKSIFHFRANKKLNFSGRVNSQVNSFKTKRSAKARRARQLRENHSCVSSSNPSELTDLPNEILFLILSHLPLLDLKSVSLSCKHLNQLANDELLWEKFCYRDFDEEEVRAILPSYETPRWRSTYSVLIKVRGLIHGIKSPMETLKDNNYNLNVELEKKRTEVKELESTLAGLSNKNTDELPTPLQELVFREVLRKKEHQSKDGFVRAKNSHGRPVVLAPIRWPEVPSDSASKRTVRERSKTQEDLTKATSTTKSQTDSEMKESINAQRVSLIKRDKEGYSECADKAGLKIFAQFTADQAAALKKEMPFELWRLVKRVLCDVAGRDVMGSEKKLRENLKDSYYEYECGTFETTENNVVKTVTFLRCTSLRQVLIKTMEQLRQANELTGYDCIPSNTLKILLCGDKGSKQTKLMMTILNSKLQHSVKRSKLLAIFEGAKDSAHCIEMAFGPVLRQAEKLIENIQELNILKPPSQCKGTPHVTSTSKKRRLARRRIRRLRRKKYHIQFTQCQSDVDVSFNSDNPVRSPCCVCCQKSDTRTNGNQAYNGSHIETGKLVHGGDWCYLSSLLQYTGPNGVYFCPFCLATLSDMTMGVPHAPQILPKYYQSSSIQSPSAVQFEQRTLEGMHAKAESFMSSRKTKDQVKSYQNCEAAPLLTTDGPVLHHMSVMPLHLSLGLGLQNVNIADNLSTALDLQIREDCGQTSDEVVAALTKRAETLEERSQLQHQLEEMEQQTIATDLRIQEIAEADPQAFAKQDKKFVSHSKDSVEKRKIVRQLKSKKQMMEKNKKNQEKYVGDADKKLEELNNWLEQQKGPFKTKFDSAMESLGLKRQVYHSGALIGKDIDTIFGSHNNICKISSVFKPINLKIANDETKTYGSHYTVQVISTLFCKFSAIYKLMSPSRCLCQHEVEFLRLRCISYGNWFPVNFPKENLKRKLHILTFHVPQKAAAEFTVGMEAEHVSESIHPVVNQLKRRYANIQSLKEQLPLLCKSQWLLSDCTIPDYRVPMKKRKRKHHEE